MKKTFKDIRQFNIAVETWARQKPENLQTKLGYAMKRVTDNSVAKAIKEYQSAYQEAFYENVERVHVDHALTDPTTKAILTAPQGSQRPYLYDKEGMKIVMDAERKFNSVTAPALLEEWDNKEFEIDPYIATELPDDLSDEMKDALKGFVL